MNPAEHFQMARPGLAVWQAYDPAVRTVLTSAAVETPAGLVLCDPVPLAAPALEALLAGRAPHAILLTNANHERHAVPLACRYGIGLWAHAAANAHLPATHWCADGEMLFGGMEAIALEGFAPGECAYRLDDLLLIGDALVNVEPYGFAILPDQYCDDPARARESLKRLLRWPLEALVFAHGPPIVAGASRRLSALFG